MSKVKQATNKPSGDKRAAPTDTAHRSQRDDPAEDDNIQEGRLPNSQSGRPHRDKALTRRARTARRRTARPDG